MIICKFLLITLLILYNKTNANVDNDHNEQCTIEKRNECDNTIKKDNNLETNEKYKKESNEIFKQIQKAQKDYTPCSSDPTDAQCECYADVIMRDLKPYTTKGITRQMLEDAAKYGTRYKIMNHRLYRDSDCMFPARCSGIEHFLLKLLPKLNNMDFVINTRDWPQLRSVFDTKGPVFSFSRTRDYLDIMYPAWTFWAGGPAISLFPTGIGRWDLLRENIMKAALKVPWSQKLSKGFFRGSRTSNERDTLVLLSRRNSDLVDAQYTKNQAWKSPEDTLNVEPAKEVSFEDHCQYKYLFNFRGVAASFRFKHLFLCKSLVFHVGDEWNEFFYFAMKPWVHYVPLKSYPNEKEIEDILIFFRNNDDLAQKIAETGYEFIRDHLKMENVECYWLNLLTKYQKLLKYETKESNEFIEINPKLK